MASQSGILTPNFVCFTLLWSQLFALSTKTETLVQKNESDELKENADNVCIDQQVQNQIINITYIQSQVRYLNQYCEFQFIRNSTPYLKLTLYSA